MAAADHDHVLMLKACSHARQPAADDRWPAKADMVMASTANGGRQPPHTQCKAAIGMAIPGQLERSSNDGSVAGGQFPHQSHPSMQHMLMNQLDIIQVQSRREKRPHGHPPAETTTLSGKPSVKPHRPASMIHQGQSHAFGAFRLNISTRQLWHDDQEVTLPLKAFECLAYLLENRERAVSRQELLENIWRNIHLTENVLDQAIFILRRTLDQATPGKTHIKTVRGFGYHWTAAVETLPPSNPPVRSNKNPRRRYGVVLAFLGISVIIIVSLSFRTWNDEGAPFSDNPERGFHDSAVLVMPAEIISMKGKHWIRYGAMDLAADRLRAAGQPVVPSETTITLLQRVDLQSIPDIAEWLASATDVDLVLHLEARDLGDQWQVVLRNKNPKAPRIHAMGESGDVFEATRIAADRLALSLGLVPAPQPTTNSTIIALVQQIKAAIMASQPEVALDLIENADEVSLLHPEVRFQMSRLDNYLERFESAEEQLQHLIDEPDVKTDPSLQARVIIGLSAFAFRRQDYAQAEDMLRTAMHIIGHRSHPELICPIASNMGLIAMMRGDLNEARSQFVRSMLACEVTGDIEGFGSVENNLGALEEIVGDHTLAIRHFEQATRRHTRTHSIDGQLRAQSNLIDVNLDRQDYSAAERALQLLDDLLGQSRQPSNNRTVALIRSRYLIATGKLSDAEQLLNSVAGDVDATGAPSFQFLQAWLAAESGRISEAEKLAYSATRKPLSSNILSEADIANTWLLLIRSRIALGRQSQAQVAMAEMDSWIDSTHTQAAQLLQLLARAETTSTDSSSLSTEVTRATYQQAMRMAIMHPPSRIRTMVLASYIQWLLTPMAGPDLDQALIASSYIIADDTYEASLARLRITHAMAASLEWQKALSRTRKLAGERQIPEALVATPVPD